MECFIKAACCSLLIFLSAVTCEVQSQNNDAALNLVPTTDGIELKLSKGGVEKLAGVIGIGYDFSNITCIGESSCAIGDNINLSRKAVDNGFEFTWTGDTDSEFTDCFDLNLEKLHWYGGPQRWKQEWPIEKLNISGSDAYIIKRSDNFAVAERYWLNSLGGYVFLDDRVPLFVDQNVKEEGKVCYIAKCVEPYINRTRNILKYTIIAGNNPKDAHIHAVNNYLKKPTGYPDERMIRDPIWTTWAKYKRNINDSIVLEFAQDILDNGFEGGQLEIDDDWERCYGSQEFKSEEFADIENTISKLKDLKFRVTLWVHPFINYNCQNVTAEGLEKDYFVKNVDGKSLGTWWNGLMARQIDFTNPHASRWYAARLNKLRESPGLDSFKFDAGEHGYAPLPSVFPGVDQELVPNILTESYIRTCAKFGTLIEARSAWRTQDLPMFTRMLDKDSVWDVNNGLYTLITTLLQMNMNGYPFVLPDMIGGNGYNTQPSIELIIRWTQANTFMPSMQFSFLPWDMDTEDANSAAIVKKFVDLHKNYTDVIIDAMKSSVENGTPVNPPIWWIDPLDPIALNMDDEYLLGENILVAPVVKEGATSRNVYLPKGTWKDPNLEKTYQAPIIIEDYPAPLDVLPYFIRQP